METPEVVERLNLINLHAYEDEEDRALCIEYADRARSYLLGMKWCNEVLDMYAGYCVGGILGIFLAHIVPGAPQADDWIWVITGDLPPAYIVVPEDPTPRQALRAYLENMRDWVNAVRSGNSTAGLISVNVPESREWADHLASRLDYLESELLPEAPD